MPPNHPRALSRGFRRVQHGRGNGAGRGGAQGGDRGVPGRGDGTGRGADAVGANMGSSQGRGDGSRDRGGGRGGQPQRNFVAVSASRNLAESSQQGADWQLQQQAQPTADQGTLKKKRAFCFRCKCSGHVNEECKADLDCIIFNKTNSHISSKCPILKLPKPNAAFFGSAKTELAFMQISEADYKLDAPDPMPTGLVTATGAPVTVEVVQTELARISRIDWQWEAFPQGQDSFLVAFPSEEALNSMVDIGYQLKNHGVTLTISVWQQDQDIIPAYELDEVWVHITGVPPSYRHYLVFWALGTVIGATPDVDMLTYRKTGVIRVKVGILNKGQLPLTTDLVFGKVGYNVTYMLEDDSFQPAIVLANTFDPMDHDAGADKGNEDNEDGGSAAKKRRNEAAQPDASVPQAGNSSGPAPMQLALTPLGKNRPCPPWKPLKMMNETHKLPWIAVTRHKNGFHPSVGSTPSKFHILCSAKTNANPLCISSGDALPAAALSDTGAPLIKSNNGSALAAADDQIMAMQRAHTAAAGNNEKVRESSTQGLQMQHSVALSDGEYDPACNSIDLSASDLSECRCDDVDEIPTGEDTFSTPGAMKADVASPAFAELCSNSIQQEVSRVRLHQIYPVATRRWYLAGHHR